MEYYCQVDKEQKARAASVMDDLLEKIDAKMTPEADFGQNSDEGQF